MKRSAPRARSWAGGWKQPPAPAPAVSFPRPGGSRFQSCSLSTKRHLRGKLMILPSFQIPKWHGGTADLGVSKRFLAIQPLGDHLVPLVCASLHGRDPTSLWHRAPSRAPVCSVFQRRVVQQLNCCWPLQTEQGLPTGAHAAPSGWCGLPWSYLR